MTHAFNVTHVAFYVILQLKLETLKKTEEEIKNGPKEKALINETSFTDLDYLAIIIACIGHDLDHPGLGNSYFTKSRDARALTGNNSSVLENYHCYYLMNLLE